MMAKRLPEPWRSLRWAILGIFLGVVVFGVYHFGVEDHQEQAPQEEPWAR